MVHAGGRRKPLDIGNGQVAASFDPATAGWISIGGPHATQGFVELSSAPSFDEAGRGDPPATRRYRASLADGDHTFLTILVDDRAPTLEPDPSITDPSWRGDALRVVCEPTRDGVRQRWRIENGATSVGVHLRGRLDRPALAEITELDPPPPTMAVTTFEADGDRAIVRTEQLDATAIVRLHGVVADWRRSTDGVVGHVVWGEAEPTAPRELVIDVALGTEANRGGVPDPPPEGLDAVAARALAYIRGCSALATGPDERVILTDHRLLPLSWTRDAYWQALALLAIDQPHDREIVADHLRWLWRRCERPDGRWLRSHHADGRRKDHAFQVDQQLYPFIELADYWRRTGQLPSGVDWERSVTRAWHAALEAVDSGTWLVATAENAADDPASVPFISASQILFWYAARRLSELSQRGALALDPAIFASVGDRVRAALREHIAKPGEAWPYAVDATGSAVRYHDANDLPVALAPIWGFCPPTDAGWIATMAFAFSPENPGFVSGPRRGLGSAHTPGPWTLGDVQEWIRAQATGETAKVRAARARLAEVAYEDGMLPEAYATSGEERIRTWFAWPGAAYAALTTLAHDGRLATIAA